MRTKVRRRPNGRWYVMSVAGDGRERSHGGYRTQREAKAAARSLEVDAGRGRYVEPSGRTLANWYAEWAATRKNLSPNSRAVEGVMWKLILEVLGKVGLQKLTATDWHRLDDVMIGRGLSGKYRRNVRASLRKALGDAEKLGYVLRNVIALTEPPSIDDSTRREAFTLDEVRALLAIEDRLHPIWSLFFETGARRGELCGLTDDDVDGSRIAIRRQVLVHPSRTWDQDRVYVRPTTKSRKERVVVVSDSMTAELRAWKAQRARERLAFGPSYEQGGWICAEADGSRIAPDTLSARFVALERKAGVPHRGLHACRHTHATLALAAGTRLDVVSRQLGHSSIAITADVYGHPDDAAAALAAERLGALFANGGMADGD